jgi:hypothetical protein
VVWARVLVLSDTGYRTRGRKPAIYPKYAL